ncbi:hypothetical protein [Acinetobacter venetianus]|uniref:hypothetical protein n=1 Tax=Acinetobacter venetianus TaxID=52133 RepID=UPI002076DFA7|nr:hypothetical protein [Acinetobacter venetianus]
MANFFGVLLLISIITTIVLLIKPSFTARNGKAAFSRGRIFLYGFTASVLSVAMIGVFAPNVGSEQLDVEQFSNDKTDVSLNDGVIVVSPNDESKHQKTQAEIDQDAKDYKQKVLAQQKALAEGDRPQFDWPPVNYTKAISKVDLHNDKAIIKAVRKPVVDQEDGANQNGEPMQSYWFSKDLASGLELSLSREYIDVAWNFNAKDQAKATEAFEDGLRITRALLGGRDGAALYENIAKGGKVEELLLEDGIVIKNARCGQFVCRYQVVR